MKKDAHEAIISSHELELLFRVFQIGEAAIGAARA